MFLRERSHQDDSLLPGAAGHPNADHLEQMRQFGQALFQEADEAIRRALSSDSLAFLNATQQEGGQ